MKKLHKHLATACAALALLLQIPAGAAAQQRLPTPIAPQPAPAEQTEPGEQGEASGPALWKLRDADTVVYLFGTVHALPVDTQWLGPVIADALDSADELVTEVDLSDTSHIRTQFMARALLPDGTKLRDLLEQEDRQAYEAAMVSIGLPPAAFDRYKPWYAAMAMSLLPMAKAGFSPHTGVEAVLDERHKAPERKRTALESAEYQLELFDSLPMDAQIAYLRDVSKAVPDMGGNLGEMVASWLKGDAEALANLINRDNSDPLVMEHLLFQRNRQWAEWIEARMAEPGTVFLAVGAGHLAGPGSVQDELAARGLAVSRLQ